MAGTTSSAPVAEAPISAGAYAQPARAKAGHRWVRIALLAVSILVIAGLGYLLLRPDLGEAAVDIFVVERRDFTVALHEKGELKAAKSIDVRCEVEGRSTIIWLIPEGTEVAEGDLLIKLASEQIDDRVRSEEIKEANAKAAAEAAAKEYDITLDEQASLIRKAELALHNAEIELEKYTEGDWKEQKTDAELDVKRAQEVLNRKREELHDARELYELHLFNLGKQFVDQLNQPTLSPALRRVFAEHDIALSSEVRLAADAEQDDDWLISDTAKRYRVRLEDGDLRVYYARNFITSRELRDKEFAVFEAEMELQKAELRKIVLHTYTHPKDFQQKTSDVDEAGKELERTRKSAEAKNAQKLADKAAKAAEYAFIQEQLEKFRRQQAKTEIRAPAAGLVVYDTGRNRWDRRQIAEGTEVYERQTIIKLPDTEVMQALVRVHEAKANKVKVGQQVRVEIEGMPGVVLDGEVTKIAPLADSQNQWLNPDLKEYETEITLGTNGYDLKPGVTARAEILVEEVYDVLAVPVQAVVTKQGRRYVFRGHGDTPEPAPVDLGRSNDEFVEVLSGLAQGDVIRLSVSEEDLQRVPELEASERDSSNGNGLAGRRPVSKPPPKTRGVAHRRGQRRAGG